MVEYFNGDLLQSNCNVICHQCNCRGVMEAGIAGMIRGLYPGTYIALRERYEAGKATLGEVDFVPASMSCNAFRIIVNMYSQDEYVGYGRWHTSYEALQTCLDKIKAFVDPKIDEHFPEAIRIGFPARIGCGLVGGSWNIAKKMIENTFSDPKYHVEIWDYNPLTQRRKE